MPRHELSNSALDGEILQWLHNVKGFVFDLDGTLVLGDRQNDKLTPLPGAIDFTHFLVDHGIPFVVFTNGSARTPKKYAKVLRSLGFPIDDADLLTPVSGAIEHFREQQHRKVMVLGGDGLTEPLREAGFETVGPVLGSDADAVLVGWYRQITFDSLEAACDAVWSGAKFYSSSQSPFFATTQGRVLSTSRMVSAVVQDLTDATVEVVGKPSRHALNAAAARLVLPPAQLAVVGDDPELEVAMAHRGGALAVLVTTGLHEESSLESLSGDRKPHLAVSGLVELMSHFR